MYAGLDRLHYFAFSYIEHNLASELRKLSANKKRNTSEKKNTKHLFLINMNLFSFFINFDHGEVLVIRNLKYLK